MFGFLKRRAQLLGAKAAREDLQRFVAGLQGMDDKEVGNVVAVAHVVRRNLTKEGTLPELTENFLTDCLTLAELSVEKDPGWNMNRLIKLFQQEKMFQSATGAMVWLHSYRCVNIPEIRNLGRAMWAELMRGIPHAPESLAFLSMVESTPVEDLLDVLDFVPPELMPRA